jgi:predicted patatin/cPLA2 family phospholipase
MPHLSQEALPDKVAAMTTGIGLVLEGGGMRAAYTGGVLDAFLDEAIDIRYVVGVSAGANAGADYVAGQRERNHRVFVDLATDPRYAGWRNLLRERSWFGMRFIFETLPDELAPFDYAAFRASPRTLHAGVTDCATGEPVYFKQSDLDARWFVQTVLRASSSLPVLSPPVVVQGRRCLDGGASDPIPIKRAIADGKRRNVVVLTRNAGYRQPPQRLGAAARAVLRRHPAVLRALRDRHLRYNECLDLVDSLESAGSVFVLRPARPLEVDRMERDVAKLEALYRQGYAETVARAEALRAWMAAGAT